LISRIYTWLLLGEPLSYIQHQYILIKLNLEGTAFKARKDQDETRKGGEPKTRRRGTELTYPVK